MRPVATGASLCLGPGRSLRLAGGELVRQLLYLHHQLVVALPFGVDLTMLAGITATSLVTVGAGSTAPFPSSSFHSACNHGCDHNSARSRHSSRPCRLVRRASRGTRGMTGAVYPSCEAPSACGLRSFGWWTAPRTAPPGLRPPPALRPQGTDSEACLSWPQRSCHCPSECPAWQGWLVRQRPHLSAECPTVVILAGFLSPDAAPPCSAAASSSR